MARRKGFFNKAKMRMGKAVSRHGKTARKAISRHGKIAAKSVSKLKRRADKFIERQQKKAAKAKVRAEARNQKSAATRVRRAEARKQRRRDRLQNNRGVGGISHEARAKIGTGTVSLAEAIIISRLEKAGKLDGHTHNQIKDMALKMVGARGRSVGFIAAGWLQSIQTLAKKTGKPFRAGAGRKAFSRNAIGRMGSCIAASDMTFRPRAVIENHANSKNDHKQALIRYGQPALQQAFDDETRSMKDYLASRMKKEAQAMGIKTG